MNNTARKIAIQNAKNTIRLAARRSELQRFARVAVRKPNKAEALYDICNKAVALNRNGPTPHPRCAERIIDDPRAVIVGDGMTNDTGRGRGKYYVGGDAAFRGAEGFRDELRYGDPATRTDEDKGFQVHHAMAGMWLGFSFPGPFAVVPAYVEWLEDEPQDKKL